MTDLKQRPARFFDEHDVVDSLGGAIWYIKDDDERRSIMKDLKEENFSGEAMVQFEWHHAEKEWRMNVYGDEDMSKGICYELSEDQVDLPIPAPQPKEKLSCGGERVELVWNHDRCRINTIADKLLDIMPGADRYEILRILDRHLTVDEAEISFNGARYKLIRE